MDKSNVVKELEVLLKDIKIRPEFYLGERSITRLYSFVEGFLYAFYITSGKKEYVGFYSGFNEWVAEKFKITTSHNWCSIIKMQQNHEVKAFDMFYKLLEEYLGNCI